MNKIIKLGEWQPKQASISSNKFNDHIERFGASVNNIDPNIVDLRKWMPPAEDQGDSSSCIENAIVGAMGFLQIRNGLPFQGLLSRLFIYYNARVLENDVNKDEGSLVEDGLLSLCKFGAPLESEWVFDLNKIFVKPTPQCYTDGLKNCLNSYYNIPDENYSEMIKKALKSDHPVIFGMQVNNDYMNYNGGILQSYSDKSEPDGGHCQVICGFNDNEKYWIIRNSWGQDWGEGGYCRMAYDYLDKAGASDFWVPYLPGTSDTNG
jgi:C1A family cysteine protease